MSKNPEVYREQLMRWGHMDDGDDIEVGIESYQDFFAIAMDKDCRRLHGRSLRADGIIGPVTEAFLHLPRCGCPDRQRIGGPSEANWPPDCRLDLTTYWQSEGLNLSDGEVDEAFEAGLASWEAVIDVAFRRVEMASNARIWSSNRPLSGTTLAWSYLATNNCRSRLEQRYNSRTRWNVQYLRAVVAHEYGHALGAGHLSHPDSLMYPYARTDVFKPQARDVAYLKSLGYNDPLAPPDPPGPKGLVASVSLDSEGVTIVYEDGGEESFKWM